MNDVSERARHSIVNWARRVRYTVRVYWVPFLVSAAAALIYLVLMAVVTGFARSALLVIVMMALPGVLAIILSHRERRHWGEYAIVWVAYFCSVPLYGVPLFVIGYGIAFARAWRRKSPHILQADEFDGTGEVED